MKANTSDRELAVRHPGNGRLRICLVHSLGSLVFGLVWQQTYSPNHVFEACAEALYVIPCPC